MKAPEEEFVLNSWNQNAHRWNSLIDKEKLESRKLVTNQAIVDVILALPSQHILDVGCGEGWLVRSLSQNGKNCRGIDGSAELIRLAQQKGDQKYACLSYGELIGGASIEGTPFDAIVFNFALFDEYNTESLLKSLKTKLKAQGHIVIQSLHPDALPQEQQGHWQQDVWQGLPESFTDSYAWYLRSMADWKKLFRSCGLRLEQTHETAHPSSGNLLSVIFVLSIV